MSIFVFADGAARGNPGPASIGVVAFELAKQEDMPSLADFKEGAEPLFTISEAIGKKTNNEAEYAALIAGLEECQHHANGSKVVFCLDSLLVVKQFLGEYKVKKPHLKPLREKAKQAASGLDLTVRHVRREQNAIADFLANEALDKKE